MKMLNKARNGPNICSNESDSGSEYSDCSEEATAVPILTNKQPHKTILNSSQSVGRAADILDGA